MLDFVMLARGGAFWWEEEDAKLDMLGGAM